MLPTSAHKQLNLAEAKNGLSDSEKIMMTVLNQNDRIGDLDISKNTEVQVGLTHASEFEDFPTVDGDPYYSAISVNGKTNSAKDDYKKFKRDIDCMLALRNVTGYIPNFVPVKTPVEVTKHSTSTGTEFLMFRTQFKNTSRLTMKSLLCANDHVPDIIIYSIYAQVINAVCVANKHVKFAHNNLTAKNVAVNVYGSVFTINYDSRAVIGIKYLATLVNYRGSQFSFVCNGEIANSTPGNLAINLEPHVSSDIYTFTLDCYKINDSLLDVTPRSDSQRYRTYYTRREIFKKLLGFYIILGSVSNITSYPINICPHRSGEDFCQHMKYILDTAGYRICTYGKQYFGNSHLPASNNDSSTWHMFDLNCLYAKMVPDTDLQSLRNMVEVGLRHDDRWMNYMCSYDSHKILEELRTNSSISSVSKLSDAMFELPVMYLIKKSTALKLLEQPEIYDFFAKTIEDILSTVLIYQSDNNVKFTIRDAIRGV
jgi:hypothetical protein